MNKANLGALCAAIPGSLAREHWSRLGIPNPAVKQLLDARFAPDERIWTGADRRRIAAFFRDAHALMLPDIERENRMLRDYAANIGMSDPSARPLIVDIGWRATSQRFLEMAVPELTGTAGAYFGLNDDGYRNGRMTAWLFDGYKHLRSRWLATNCVEIMELMFSAPHPSMQRIGRDPEGKFVPVYEPSTPEEDRRIDIVRKVPRAPWPSHVCSTSEGPPVIPFTSIAMTRQNSSTPSCSSRRLPTSGTSARCHTPAGSARRITRRSCPRTSPQTRSPYWPGTSGRRPSRIHWTGGFTRAVGLQYGAVRELASRLTVSAARVMLVVRERLDHFFSR